MKNSFLKALVFLTLAPLSAHANQKIEKCIQRVDDACKLSHNDQDRIDDSVTSCKQFRSFGSVLEVFLLGATGKLVTVKTKGAGAACNRMKYAIDDKGIKKMLVIEGRLFMVSNDGAVYYMRSNGSQEVAWEVLNSKKKSYKGVDDIKGSAEGQPGIHFLDASGHAMQINDGKDEITGDDIDDLFSEGRLRQMSFQVTNTNRSLFRDE